MITLFDDHHSVFMHWNMAVYWLAPLIVMVISVVVYLAIRASMEDRFSKTKK